MFYFQKMLKELKHNGQWFLTLFTTESICTVMQIHGGGLQGCCRRECLQGCWVWFTEALQQTMLGCSWGAGLQATCKSPLSCPADRLVGGCLTGCVKDHSTLVLQLHEDFFSHCPLSLLWKASGFSVATYSVKSYPVWGAVRCCLWHLSRAHPGSSWTQWMPNSWHLIMHLKKLEGNCALRNTGHRNRKARRT